jgi:hypothetical protein
MLVHGQSLSLAASARATLGVPALVTIGTETKQVASNESVFVPIKTPHRLENPGSEPVRIIEVQTGSYLGEDDIVRLDDDFWRLSKGDDSLEK